MVRIDHFRDLEEYFNIPKNETHAKEKKKKKGPGMDLFHALEGALGKREIIAEDLGLLTPEVEELLKDNTCGQFERLLEDITASRHIKTKEEVLEYFRDDIYYSVKWEIEEKLEREKNLSWRDISDWINKNKEKFNKMVQEEIDKQVSELKDSDKR